MSYAVALGGDVPLPGGSSGRPPLPPSLAQPVLPTLGPAKCPRHEPLSMAQGLLEHGGHARLEVLEAVVQRAPRYAARWQYEPEAGAREAVRGRHLGRADTIRARNARDAGATPARIMAHVADRRAVSHKGRSQQWRARRRSRKSIDGNRWK
jgi:hypothetical protein